MVVLDPTLPSIEAKLPRETRSSDVLLKSLKTLLNPRLNKRQIGDDLIDDTTERRHVVGALASCRHQLRCGQVEEAKRTFLAQGVHTAFAKASHYQS